MIQTQQDYNSNILPCVLQQGCLHFCPIKTLQSLLFCNKDFAPYNNDLPLLTLLILHPEDLTEPHPGVGGVEFCASFEEISPFIFIYAPHSEIQNNNRIQFPDAENSASSGLWEES